MRRISDIGESAAVGEPAQCFGRIRSAAQAIRVTLAEENDEIQRFPLQRCGQPVKRVDGSFNLKTAVDGRWLMVVGAEVSVATSHLLTMSMLG